MKHKVLKLSSFLIDQFSKVLVKIFNLLSTWTMEFSSSSYFNWKCLVKIWYLRFTNAANPNKVSCSIYLMVFSKVACFAGYL